MERPHARPALPRRHLRGSSGSKPTNRRSDGDGGAIGASVSARGNHAGRSTAVVRLTGTFPVSTYRRREQAGHAVRTVAANRATEATKPALSLWGHGLPRGLSEEMARRCVIGNQAHRSGLHAPSNRRRRLEWGPRCVHAATADVTERHIDSQVRPFRGVRGGRRWGCGVGATQRETSASPISTAPIKSARQRTQTK